MAEIYGVTLKGLTKFRGMENDAYQGNIYMDGKKVGWFSQSGDGGSSYIRYDAPGTKEEINKRIQKYFKKYPPDVEWTSTDEFFYDILVQLILDEKAFKSAVKKGYAWYAIAAVKFDLKAEDYHYLPARAYKIPAGLTGKACIERFIEARKAEGYDKITIYKSLDDFIVK